MTEHTDLAAQTRAMHARFLAATAGLDPATCEQEPVCGVWTIRDLAGHLDAWAIEITGSAALAIGEDFTPDALVSAGEAFNMTHAAQRAGDSWETARARLDATIERAVALIERTTPEQREQHVDYPWGGSGNLGTLLSGVAGHHREHIEEIEAWRAARGL